MLCLVCKTNAQTECLSTGEIAERFIKCCANTRSEFGFLACTSKLSITVHSCNERWRGWVGQRQILRACWHPVQQKQLGQRGTLSQNMSGSCRGRCLMLVSAGTCTSPPTHTCTQKGKARMSPWCLSSSFCPFSLYEITSIRLESSSSAKSTCSSSCSGLCGCQHPHGGSQPPVTPVPGDLTPSSGRLGHQACT